MVHVYFIAVARHALTEVKRSKVKVTRYEDRHGRTVASDNGGGTRTPVLPAAVAGVGLHVDTTAYVI